MQSHNRKNFDEKPEDVLCLNCYKTGHRRHDPCPNSSIMACSRCFRRDVISDMCNCRNRDKPNPPQTLRFVKGNVHPLLFIDVEIRGRYYEAVINTRAEESIIGNSVFKWLTELGYSSNDQRRITVPIKIVGPPIDLKCKIERYLEYPLEIGMDYLFQKGLTFGFLNVFLNSKYSPVSTYPNETNYVYDLVPEGLPLREYLERKGQLPTNNEKKRSGQSSPRAPPKKRVKSEISKPIKDTPRKYKKD